MKWLTNFLSTSIGRKQLMALTGLGLGGFLMIHLSGNFLLLASDGGVMFNTYAEWLGGQIWLNGARAGLLTCLVVHMYLAIRLSAHNRHARRTDYFYKNPSEATLASRSMLLTGVLIFLFVIMHLFNFTWADKSGPKGLYGVVEATFSQPFWAGLYVVCMLVLTGHLVHAIQSVFQTFGINHSKHTPTIKGLCLLVALGLGLGFASIPIWFIVSKGGI